jgi:hypothetical protein
MFDSEPLSDDYALDMNGSAFLRYESNPRLLKLAWALRPITR